MATEREREASVGTLISGIVGDAQELVRKEIALARQEIREEIGNAKDAGPQKKHFALDTNAYGRNFIHDFAEMGTLEPSGRWLPTFDEFKSALEKGKSLLPDLGEVSKTVSCKQADGRREARQIARGQQHRWRCEQLQGLDPHIIGHDTRTRPLDRHACSQTMGPRNDLGAHRPVRRKNPAHQRRRGAVGAVPQCEG